MWPIERARKQKRLARLSESRSPRSLPSLTMMLFPVNGTQDFLNSTSERLPAGSGALDEWLYPLT